MSHSKKSNVLSRFWKQNNEAVESLKSLFKKSGDAWPDQAHDIVGKMRATSAEFDFSGKWENFMGFGEERSYFVLNSGKMGPMSEDVASRAIPLVETQQGFWRQDDDAILEALSHDT